MKEESTYSVFAGDRLLTTATLHAMLLQTKTHMDCGESDPVLIFEDHTGRQIDFDFRGSPDEVLARLATHPLFAATQGVEKPHSGPGRPKLGVVCREVSLLPRHWEWLERQSGGSSAALRRLVDEARKREPEKDDIGQLRDAAGRFMSVMAGNLRNFEEVARHLYAGRYGETKTLMSDWPKDIREHSLKLIARCIQAESPLSEFAEPSQASYPSHSFQP